MRSTGDEWLAPVAPGYNNGTCVPRLNGETLRRLYEGNRASRPNGWTLISWNEITENTHVVPLRRYGGAYVMRLGATLR